MKEDTLVSKRRRQTQTANTKIVGGKNKAYKRIKHCAY
jgi:hypothetical protein